MSLPKPKNGSLFELTVQADPLELSGSTTSSRYDFQKNWALCKIIDLHQSNKEYLLLLDYHEDVAIFDSENESSAKSAEFYQIKTRAGRNWTVNYLSKQGSDGKPSILKKLFNNRLLFEDYCTALVFESNIQVATKLASGSESNSKAVVFFSELSAKDKQKVHESIEGKTCEVCDIAGLQQLAFIRCSLSLEDHNNHSLGVLANFIEDQLPGESYRVKPIYRVLFDEIKRRTGHVPSTKSWEEVRRKAIGRSDVERMLSDITKQKHTHLKFHEISPLLLSEGLSAATLLKARSNWDRYGVSKLEGVDARHTQLELAAKAAASDWGQEKDQSLSEFANQAANLLMSDFSSSYSIDYIRVSIYYEVTALEDEPIQTLGTEPTEEAR